MYKSDFPFFKDNKTVYLDSGATTQKPQIVIDSQIEYYEKYCANTHRSNFDDANKATTEFEEARESLRSFINAKHKEEISFTKGVTESINFIASSYAKKFKTIIISSLEHHANIVPWHLQGRTLHAGLEVVECDENLNFDFKNFEEILCKNPNSFVSISHVSNAFGKVHDIKRITTLAHKHGCVVMIDGAQSFLHAKIDVQELDVDFFAISAHKSLGPTGVGAIYIKEKHQPQVAPYQGGGGAIEEVTYEKTTFYPAPYQYEPGTQNIAGVIGFKEALKYISNIGIETIKKKNRELYLYLYSELKKIDDIILYCDTNCACGSMSFNIKGLSCDDIGILLSKLHVSVRVGHHCAQPIMRKLNVKGTVRASIGFYNDKEDIDKFITALKRVIGILKG